MTLHDLEYHCQQARTYISLPAASTSERHMTTARWHLDKALAALGEHALAEARDKFLDAMGETVDLSHLGDEPVGGSRA